MPDGIRHSSGLVLGFNNLRFDYEVLQGYTSFDLRQLPTLDLMVKLQDTLRYRRNSANRSPCEGTRPTGGELAVL